MSKTTAFQKKPPIRLTGKAWLAEKKKAYERDKKRCVWCGNPYNLTPAHIIRRSQGGSDTAENIMTACIIGMDGGKGCHYKFDDKETGLPQKVWNRMSNEHREQYCKTRRTMLFEFDKLSF